MRLAALVSIGARRGPLDVAVGRLEDSIDDGPA